MSKYFTKTQLVTMSHDINRHAKHELIITPEKQTYKNLYGAISESLECRLDKQPANVQTCKKTTPISALNINRVIKKYFKSYPNFEYLGTFSVDFAKMFPQYNNITLNKHNKYAMIINTDVYNGNGKHWVCVFIDMSNKQIYYFDSYGKKAPRQIKGWINNICHRYNLTYTENKTVYQIGNTECGIYAIYFIKTNLSGKSWDDKICDHDMLMFRKTINL